MKEKKQSRVLRSKKVQKIKVYSNHAFEKWLTRIADLSMIEENINDRSFFYQIAKSAGQNAINENKALKIPITFLQNGWVVRKMPDGTVEKVVEVPTEGIANKARKLNKGVVLHVKKATR